MGMGMMDLLLIMVILTLRLIAIHTLQKTKRLFESPLWARNSSIRWASLRLSPDRLPKTSNGCQLKESIHRLKTLGKKMKMICHPLLRTLFHLLGTRPTWKNLTLWTQGMVTYPTVTTKSSKTGPFRWLTPNTRTSSWMARSLRWSLDVSFSSKRSIWSWSTRQHSTSRNRPSRWGSISMPLSSGDPRMRVQFQSPRWAHV